MSAGTEQRKLAAIMFTDMVGYSALAQRNETLALELLEEQRGLLRSLFPRFNGREVKTIGDAFLVEFHSALEAAQCAIEIQRALAKRNHDVAAGRRIEVRIGIHIGDVVQRADGDVLGDGVNIASRIEPLAGANGICISVDVERQIRNTIEASLVKLGATELKNIQVPMELFRIVLPWEKEDTSAQTRRPPGAYGKRTGLVAVCAIGMWVLIGTGWFIFHKAVSPSSSQPGTGAVPLRPGPITSLAVLPFLNPSRDPEQEFFVDGFTDLLCTELAGISALRKVISRTTAMQFKGTSKKIPEIAAEFGVDAVVGGSVQRESNRVVVSVQLIEGATGRYLWATNYERELNSVLKLKMELARAIATEIRVQLTPQEKSRLASARSVNPAAFDSYLQGRQYWYQFTREGLQKATEANHEAIRIDPDFGPAHAELARAYVALANIENLPPKLALEKARAEIAKAVDLGESWEAHEAQAAIQIFLEWDWPATTTNLDRALLLRPSDGAIRALYSVYSIAMGRWDEAAGHARRAAELEPVMPLAIVSVPRVLLYWGHYEEAIREYLKISETFPRFLHVVYGLGRADERSGQPARAVEVFEKALENGRAPMLLEGFATALIAAGRQGEARKIAAELEAKYLETVRTQQAYVSPWHLAVVSVAIGEKQHALDWLERGYEERAWGMFLLKVEPAFESIRSEERFQILLKKMNFPP